MKRLLLLLLTIVLGTSCSVTTGMTMRGMLPVLEEMELSVNASSDLETIRDGLPSGMLFLEAIVRKLPSDHRARLLASKIYSGYAIAFAEESDHSRAVTLYLKAKDHGLMALPGGTIIREGKYRDAEQAISRLGKNDVPLLFWTAQAWAGAIRLGLDNPRNLAALARVEAMMDRVLQLDGSYYHGGPHLFAGVLLGAKPPPAGGDPDLGLQRIDEALRISEGHFLLALYYKAALLATLPGREEEAKETIGFLLENKDPHPEQLTLTNTVAMARAKHLLARILEEEL